MRDGARPLGAAVAPDGNTQGKGPQSYSRKEPEPASTLASFRNGSSQGLCLIRAKLVDPTVGALVRLSKGTIQTHRTSAAKQ